MGEISSSNENINFYKLIAKAEKCDPVSGNVIAKIVKQGEEYVTEKWLKGISGWITKAEVKEFEYENKKQKKFVLQLSDSSGIYQLEFTPTTAAAGIINCLLSADLTREITIESWTKEDKNGKQFVNACAKYAGESESIKWAIELKDIPKPVMVDLPSGGSVSDNGNVRKFWIDLFVEKVLPKAVKSNFKGTIAERQPVAEQQVPVQTDQVASFDAQKPEVKSEPIGDSRSLSEIAFENDLPFVIVLLLSIGTLIPF